MPVLHVHTSPSPFVEQQLTAACNAVATSLGLPDDGVIAVHVPTGAVVRPGHPDTQWPVVVVHGSARDRDLMDTALDALRAEVSTWTPGGEAWVTWQVPA